MTEATAPALQPESVEFLQIWSNIFSEVLGQITGSVVPCTVGAEAPADLVPAGEGDFWAMVTSSGALRGEMSLRLAAANVLHMAQIFMNEPATSGVQPTSDHQDAVVELLRQVSGKVASAAKARWGEVQLRVECAPSAPSWPSAGTLWLQAGEPGTAGMILEFGLSAALVAELRADKSEAAKAAAAPGLSAPGVSAPGLSAPGLSEHLSVSASGALSSASEPLAGTLDLLMDVHLAMTMRFGARKLLLREVLDLGPGAVVELDRKVEEPVDLLLDGRLVARGEVVLIEGNYGLRVTEVSPLDPGTKV
jgi:flagellar motor switch protein FliN